MYHSYAYAYQEILNFEFRIGIYSDNTAIYFYSVNGIKYEPQFNFFYVTYWIMDHVLFGLYSDCTEVYFY